MQIVSPAGALSQLWTVLGQPADVLLRATLTGAEPALPSSFAVGTLAQSTSAAAALAAAQVDTLRSGRQQTVSVDMHHAALEFRSERYFRVEDQLPPEPWDESVWRRWTGVLKERTGRKGKALFLPLRLALTGRAHGPEMSRLLPLIGRERALSRLRAGAASERRE